MFAQCAVFIVLGTLTLALPNDDPSFQRFRGHIVKKNGQFEIVTALDHAYKQPDASVDNLVASGFWDQTYNTTGWSVLEIKTSENQSNVDQAYSAGLLEGRFTEGEDRVCAAQSENILSLSLVELTGMQWKNSIDDICFNQTVFCGYLKQFFQVQLYWIYDQIDSFPEDDYWQQVHGRGIVSRALRKRPLA